MALPSFLKRKSSAVPPVDDPGEVRQARTWARRRLIGAAVLLLIGVIAFPLMFETQPRPIPVDIPIEIPRKDGLPPLSPPPKTPRVSTGQVAMSDATAIAEPASQAASVAQAAERMASSPPPAAAPAARPPTPSPAPVAAAVKDKPAAAPAPPKAVAPAKAAPAAAAEGRFVVQVGAFADASTVRDVRAKVEKLGLKTYTQIVETAQGKRTRVRVGPFGTEEEAVKVLTRLKAAQLPGAVLAL